MTARSVLHVAVLLLAAAGSFAALPNGWKPCKRSAADYEECLKKEILHALGSLVNGDKKMNVMPIDPLRISHLEIPKGSGPVNLDLHFKNLDIIGIKNLQMLKIKNDWKTLECNVKVPELNGLGDYNVDGQVIVLPIKGEGKCNITLHNTDIKLKANINTVDKNGKKYFNVEKMHLELVPEHFYVELTNLFNGDKALGDNMNKFLNENWDKILEELKPGISEALSQAFSQITNNVFSRIPADEIDVK